MAPFFGCYLLESKHPQAKGRSYIGFTVNPPRRIRQHNGEITNGAFKTKKWRPWEMVLVVHGFPTQTQALQFEWAWQHPEKSLDVRDAAARLGKKARYGLRGKVALLMEMLNAEPWRYYPLSVQFLSSALAAERGQCPAPPAHVQVTVAPMEALPEGSEDVPDPESGAGSEEEEGEGGTALAAEASSLTEQASEGAAAAAAAAPAKKRGGARAATACRLCGRVASRTWVPCACGVRSHVECLARSFLGVAGGAGSGMPVAGQCPGCAAALTWTEALHSTRNVGWGQNKRGTGQQASAATSLATQQQQSQGPGGRAPGSVSKAPKPRKPRAKKSAAAGGAAAAEAAATSTLQGADAAAAAAGPKKPRGRPRKKADPPLAAADIQQMSLSVAAGSSDILAAGDGSWRLGAAAQQQGTARPSGLGDWGDPGGDAESDGGSPIAPLAARLQRMRDASTYGAAAAGGQQRRSLATEVAAAWDWPPTELLSVMLLEGDSSQPGSQQQQQQRGQSPPAAAPPGAQSAPAVEVMDLTSPSPPPLRARLGQQAAAGPAAVSGSFRLPRLEAAESKPGAMAWPGQREGARRSAGSPEGRRQRNANPPHSPRATPSPAPLRKRAQLGAADGGGGVSWHQDGDGVIVISD